MILWLVICQLALPFWGSSSALAQSSDTAPPQIDFRALEEGRRGDAQVFSATIKDDTAVKSVTLHYRFEPGEPYRSSPMEALGGTGIYTTSIGGADTDTAVIQYYIEARDEIGNRSIEGFPFDPLERRLLEPGVPIAGPTPAPEEPGPGLTTGQKVLYGVLGVVLVGTLAAVAGGGGGGGSDGTPPLGDDTDVPVTIVVDPLP